MIYPPIFATCNADGAVQAQLGSPCRLFPFGQAEGVNGGPPERPYAVWRTVSGSPENYLGDLPDADTWTIQIDVFSGSAYASREGAKALRNAIEPVAHVVNWNGEDIDPVTKNYRCSFTVDWLNDREPDSN